MSLTTGPCPVEVGFLSQLSLSPLCHDFPLSCKVYHIIVLLNWMAVIIITDFKWPNFFPPFSVSIFLPFLSFPHKCPILFSCLCLIFSNTLALKAMLQEMGKLCSGSSRSKNSLCRGEVEYILPDWWNSLGLVFPSRCRWHLTIRTEKTSLQVFLERKSKQDGWLWSIWKCGSQQCTMLAK